MRSVGHGLHRPAVSERRAREGQDPTEACCGAGAFVDPGERVEAAGIPHHVTRGHCAIEVGAVDDAEQRGTTGNPAELLQRFHHGHPRQAASGFPPAHLVIHRVL